MNWIECTSIFQNLTVGGAAIITSIVARRGLGTWKKQLQGSAEFETARSLAKSAYKLREAIHQCRSPFISAHEFPKDYNPLRHTAREEADAYAHIYQKRWEPISIALLEFDGSALEAEALWGDQIRTATDQLLKVIRNLNAGIHAFISDKIRNGSDFENDRDFGVKIRRVIHSSPTDTDNETTAELIKAVAAINSVVRPHLNRQNI